MARPVTSSPAQLVSLTGTGARVFVWAYFAATAALAIWTIPHWTQPVLPALLLALYAILCLAMTLDESERLSLPVTLAGVAIAPLSVALAAWQLTPGGYTAWYVGAATAFLFLVALRGRIVLAWVGCALFVLAMALWGATSWAGVEDAVLTATRQSAILVVGTLTAVGLRRTARQVRKLNAEASVRGAAEAASLGVAEERAERLADLRESVVPLLERIAAAESPTDDDRRLFAAAEADLRDGLRARGLRQRRLVDAARAARSRGVDVVLLDDSDPESLDDGDLAYFAEVTVAALDSAADGRVTARLLPPGRESIGTVVADGSRYSRHDVARTRD